MASVLEQDIGKWFTEHIPEGWFSAPVEVAADDDEILVTGALPDGDPGSVAAFRESTRKERIEVAIGAEKLFGRKVSWAVTHKGAFKPFTGLGAPVMTRLRLRERRLLDTLIDGGIARSRSDALAWCARLVASNEGEWIGKLREAFRTVEDVRSTGPDPDSPSEH